jgi:hypothetical protein
VELSDLSELHYITHIDNVVSILEHGILCHRDAELYNHISVADQDIQARRAGKRVPGGLPLHHYANLYINARNPMLYRNCREHNAQSVCVLRVSKKALFLPKAVIADKNAAAAVTRFYPSPVGLSKIDKNLVFAEYWFDDDPIIHRQKTWAICAEVLIPGKIEPSLIEGIFVASQKVEDDLKSKGIALPLHVNRKMFFLGAS